MRVLKPIIKAILLLSFFMAAFAVCADGIGPTGTWQTIDDATGKPRSIVKIWNENGELQGKIEKVFYQAGEGPDDVCKKCTGSFHNQLILGMTILWGMVNQGNNVWGGGRILDPHNGKIYRCKITLSADEQTASVRGYIGVPIVGRTQTWQRVQSPQNA